MYVPAPELEGDAAFDDRKAYYEGSGINFSKYDQIKFEVRFPPSESLKKKGDKGSINSCFQVTGDSRVKSFTNFEDFKLRDLVKQNIAKVGYATPTPIQRHASPQLIAGLDVMACAQTGSGKTVSCNFRYSLMPCIMIIILVS